MSYFLLYYKKKSRKKMSPYKNLPPEEWMNKTNSLLEDHPLSESEIKGVVLSCWHSIFDSRFGTSGFAIGEDIFPKPQIMGFLLHELIPLELSDRFKGLWKGDENSNDKDCVYIPENKYSFEVKTSSNKNKIFGNRSYAQSTTRGKKSKDGYYLTVNFEKFNIGKDKPKVKIIRFGWIDSTDWIGQTAATGQQSRLPSEVYDGKLKVIHEES